jgi:hypothetical protein
MPSQFDNTYHAIYKKPTFDGTADEKMYKITREADEVFEMKESPIPT